MRSRFLKIFFAAAIAGTSLAAPGVASARESFGLTFSTGDVDVAYRDGWWDRYHHFHHWRHHEREWYRAHYRHYYRDWDHERDRDRYRHHDRYRDRDWDDSY